MSGRYASSALTRLLIQEADCFPKDADLYDIIDLNITLGDSYRNSFNILQTHCRICIILGLVGLFLNILLLYVVLTHSRRLESVRNLFIVTVVIDLVLALINIICIPYVHPTQGYYIGIVNVPYPIPNAGFINVLANICGAFTSSSWACLTMQFIYRLHMIKSGRQMKGREFKTFVITALVVLTITNIAAVNIYGRPPDPRWLQNAQKILQNAGIDVDDRLIVGGKMGDRKVAIFVLLASVIAFVGYGAVVYTEVSRRLWLRKSVMAERTRQMTSKANSAFLALAIGPFVTEMIPMSALNAVVRSCEPIHLIPIVANLVVVCGPIVNAISAIALVKPYRNFIFEFFTNKRLEDVTPTVSATKPQEFSVRTSVAVRENI